MNKEYTGNRTFIGWDTETINNGQIVIIANSRKEYRVLASIEEILEFMLNYENNKYLNYFYNLNYDILSLIMTVAEHNNKLNDIKLFIESNHLVYKEYTLIFIKGKMLTILKNAHSKEVRYFNSKRNEWMNRTFMAFDKKAVFYDISQFYLNQYGKIMKLQDASMQYLGFGKLGINDIDNIDIERLEHDNIYRDKLVKYCIRDAHLVKRLTYTFRNMIKHTIDTKKFLSPAYLSYLYIKKFLKDNDLEEEYTNKYIMKHEDKILSTYYGGRFETLKKGSPFNYVQSDKPDTGELYLYDINSAYPTVMSTLKGLRGNATITHNQEDLELSKCYPIINIDLEYNNDYLNMIPFKNNEGLVYFPSVRKTVKKWVTHYELELLDLIGSNYHINKIIHFWKSDNLIFPFINELYQLKKEGEYKKVAKIILNSMYGKTVERTNRNILTSDYENSDMEIIINGWVYFIKKLKKVRGKIYNPLFGTEITAYCRNAVTKPIIKQQLQKNLYQIATDSILLDRKIDLPLSKNLGDWGLDMISNPTIYGNGLLEYDAKYKDGEIIDKGFKCRGFHCSDKKDNSGRIIKTAKEEFIEIINTKKYNKEMVIPLNHYKKWGFDRIHSFQEITKNFSITDKKRKFAVLEPSKLKNTLIDSKPLFWN